MRPVIHKPLTGIWPVSGFNEREMNNPLTLCELAAKGSYRGCQKNVPIEDRFSATNPYTAIIFSEHYYDKRYIC